ncbi:MAG: alkaline phosphatase family protein [Lachnospiraceae bacterium]|nr:alkaline phosphatase family protein [Lachnospiraceae bacterium]
MKQKLIVMSADALTYEDVEYMRTLPNYKKYLEGGSRVKKVRSIYPTITYPCHTTMCTGVWPDKHGVLGNLELRPGAEYVPWKWYHESVRWGEDIFKAAKRAGLTTAAIFWPVTGRHPDIDYLINECWPEPGENDIREVFRRSGSSEEMLDIIEAQMQGITIRTHPQTDDFLMRCAREIILKYQPDLLMIHPANVDDYRHRFGLFNDQVTKGVEETDRFIGELMGAVEEAGLADCTNFVLTSDHGMLDIKRVVNPNVLLADAGFVEVDEQGKIKDWKAYCQSGGTQALVYLKDDADRKTYDEVFHLLTSLAEEGIYGFDRVFTREEISKQQHLDGTFSFVLETDGYTSFGSSLVRPLVVSFNTADYRYGKATHGHLPDRGPQPVFSAKGPGFEKNVTIETADLVDEAPTYAKLLGLDLRGADGRALTELLKTED